METNIIDQINQNMDELIHNLDIKFKKGFNKGSILLYLNNKLLFFNRISIVDVISFIEDKTINSPFFSYDLEVEAIQNKYFILAQGCINYKFDSDIEDLLNSLKWLISIELIPMLETLTSLKPISIENKIDKDYRRAAENLLNVYHPELENSFSVPEWASIFYYANESKLIDHNLYPTMISRFKAFITKHNLTCSYDSFKNKYHETETKINKCTYSPDKLRKIVRFIDENYNLALNKVKNDIVLIENNGIDNQ